MKKIEARNRRARKLRSLSEGLNVNRLAIFRSAKHIYAQVFSVDGKQRFFVEESENKKMVKDLSIKIGEKLKSESKGSYKR